MDIILDVNGKYTILFNGSVIPCADDAECPFHSICFVGLDFMSSDQCGCASEVALVGLQCDEPSPLSMGYTAISVICWYIFDFVTMYTNAQNELQLTFSTACIICFTMFMTALVLLFRIYQNGLIKKLQVLSTSIFLSFVASLSLFVVNVYLVMFSTLPLDKNEVSGSSNLGQASTSISFFFVSISVLNLALLWIRVAKMGSQRPHRFPYGPLLFVCAYYLVFGTLILVFAILGQAIYSLYVAAPALFLATICYLVAVYRLNIVVRQLDVAIEQSSSNQEKETRRFMRNIASSASRAAAFLTLVLVISGIFAGIFASTTYLPWNPPDDIINGISFHLFWFFISLTQVVCIGYCYYHVRTQFGSKMESSKASDNPKFSPELAVTGDNEE